MDKEDGLKKAAMGLFVIVTMSVFWMFLWNNVVPGKLGGPNIGYSDALTMMVMVSVAAFVAKKG